MRTVIVTPITATTVRCMTMIATMMEVTTNVTTIHEEGDNNHDNKR